MFPDDAALPPVSFRMEHTSPEILVSFFVPLLFRCSAHWIEVLRVPENIASCTFLHCELELEYKPFNLLLS